MSVLQLVNFSNLVDAIDWDNDLKKWTIGDAELDNLVFSSKDVCEGCQNNPLNGGSGVCNCILGQQPIN